MFFIFRIWSVLLLLHQYLLNMFCNSLLIIEQQLFPSKHFRSLYAFLSSICYATNQKVPNILSMFSLFSHSYNQILSNNSLTEVVYLIFKIALEIKINQWMISFSKSLFIFGINTAKRTLVASSNSAAAIESA